MMACLGNARLHKGSKVICLKLTQIKSTGREEGKEKDRSSHSAGRKDRKLHCEFLGQANSRLTVMIKIMLLCPSQ